MYYKWVLFQNNLGNLADDLTVTDITNWQYG